jgi:pimeloyl-ACP methyl ester carboxylesterase
MKPTSSSSSSLSQTTTDVQHNQSSPMSRYLCGLNTTIAINNRSQDIVPSIPPDSDFCGDSLIKLTHGTTAFKIIEPRPHNQVKNNTSVIVCLHGMYSSSFMWADIGDLLSDFDQGPNARVLVFDFYGHGRSTWDGVKLTLDILVTQTKELMDCKHHI